MLDGACFHIVTKGTEGTDGSAALDKYYFCLSPDLQRLEWTVDVGTTGEDASENTVGGCLQLAQIVRIEWCTNALILHVQNVHKRKGVQVPKVVALKLRTYNEQLQHDWCRGLTCLLEFPRNYKPR